jgi:hypothetical protein
LKLGEDSSNAGVAAANTRAAETPQRDGQPSVGAEYWEDCGVELGELNTALGSPENDFAFDRTPGTTANWEITAKTREEMSDPSKSHLIAENEPTYQARQQFPGAKD